MTSDIQILDPTKYQGWDDLVLSNPDHSFFHSSSWAKVLSESYGYTPKFFTLLEGNKIIALIPVMEIKSFLTGKRGVSLPFTDYCDPIVSGNVRFQELLEYIIEYGKKRGWKCIELRGGNGLLPSGRPSLTYLGHTLYLSDNHDGMPSTFRDSTKRNIRKSIKEGVKVELLQSLDSVQEFYRLNCMTRKDHGLPPQPYYFFEKVFNYVISRNLGLVVLASFEEKPIAGAVYFHLGEKAIYKYGASDKKYQHLRANNLIMWEAIRWCCKNGIQSISFGRTEPENEGLLQFKRGWGTVETDRKSTRLNSSHSF